MVERVAKISMTPRLAEDGAGGEDARASDQTEPRGVGQPAVGSARVADRGEARVEGHVADVEDPGRRDGHGRAPATEVGQVDQGQVGMGVDETGDDGETAKIQLHARRRAPTHLGDPLALHGDHAFSHGAGTCAIDHVRPPQHEARHAGQASGSPRRPPAGLPGRPCSPAGLPGRPCSPAGLPGRP